MDPRDRDDQILGTSPAATGSATGRSIRLTPEQKAALPSPDESLQQLLDRATGGAMPHLKNDTYLPDGLCVSFEGDRRCQWPETDWVYLGCEHEHISRSGLCGGHATATERFKGSWRCQVCYDRTGEIVRARFIKREPITDGEARQAPAPQGHQQGGAGS